MELGRLERVENLRSIWKHEEYDFSTWLCEEENLNLLGETIGLYISFIEKEAKAGNFEIDILAEENNTGRKIIIENQLEDTNHDHLGKIITYASVKSAEFIIWIVKSARDEHRQAIEWLNNHTDENVNFFLLEIELWKIGNSKIAPKFNIVEQPNEWLKIERKINTTEISSTKRLQLSYWKAFFEYCNVNKLDNRLKISTPRPQHWLNIFVGTSKYYLCLTANTQKNLIGVEIYIPNNKSVFSEFENHKMDIETYFEKSLEWIEAKKACRIVLYSNGNINNEDDWENQFEFFCDSIEKFKKVIDNY